LTEPELRIVQLVNLQEQLAAFGQELYGLEPESFEQVQVLKRWAPIHEAALVQPPGQQADAAAALERYLDQDAARVKAEAARSLLVG
jgi:hypothetical protein